MSKQLTSFIEGGVEVTHKGAGKWEFFLPVIAYKYYSKSPGGRKTAKRIARILSGSAKRKGTVDGLARSMVRKLVGSPKKGLEAIVY